MKKDLGVFLVFAALMVAALPEASAADAVNGAQPASTALHDAKGSGQRGNTHASKRQVRAGSLSPECARFFKAHPNGRVEATGGDDRYGYSEAGESADFNRMIDCNAQRNAMQH
ncbi:hypothetical protein [Ralstonia insidiosa]|uniref:Uncharacterized protein n=1 Tax=Ralstonia insidiosa TaxID=190721 RepID=A0A848PBH6_9RALS|nr:hypothetical protein [Ralstonia insidiosa]NMV41956.1 hypothetical protein [Ralstonia insidiosa]